MSRHLGKFAWLLFLLPVYAFAFQPPSPTPPAPPIQKPLLAAKDTVYIRVKSSNHKYLIHRMRSGQTLYRIAKFYGLTMNDLYHFNPSLEHKSLKIGQGIKIPISSQAILTKAPRGLTMGIYYIPVCYKVRPKETLYSIGKRYFQIPIETLKQRNKLKSNNLETGQKLHIGWIKSTGIIDTVKQYTGLSAAVWGVNVKLRDRYRANKVGKERKASGVAAWQFKEKSTNPSNLFAMHRTAKVGSVIRVHNPMTNRVLYAKVIARIPPAAYDNNVIVVLSPAVARALGARDPRFHVKVSYYK